MKNLPSESRLQQAMALIADVRRSLESELGRSQEEFEFRFRNLPLRPSASPEGRSSTYSQILSHALSQGLKYGFSKYRSVWENQTEIVTWHFRSRHRDGVATEDGGWVSGQVFFGNKTTQVGIKAKLKSGADVPSSSTVSTKSRTIPFLARSPYIALFREELLSNGIPVVHYPCDELAADGGRFTTLVVPPEITARYLVKAELPDQFNRFPDQPSPGNLLPDELATRLKMESEGVSFLRALREWRNSFRLGHGSIATEAVTSDEDILREFIPLTKVTLQLLRVERGAGRKLSEGAPSRSTCLAPVFVSGDDVGGFALVFQGLVTAEEASIASQLAHTSLSLLRLREDVIARRDFTESVRLDFVKTFAVRRLSHGIRHPVGVVKASAQNLASMVKRMVEEVDEIQRRVDDSLEAILGRDVSSVLRPQFEEDLLWEYMQDIEFALRPQLLEKPGKEMVLEKGEGVTVATRIRIDKQMIREALENIIGNAIEHGGERVVFRGERLGANTLVLVVADNGPGVSDPVYRAILRSESMEFPPLRSGSRGMGLVLSKLLVSSHGAGAHLTYADPQDSKNSATSVAGASFRLVLPGAITN